MPSTGLSDHKVRVYRDRDGDGHYVRKEFDRSGHHHHYSHGGYHGGTYYRAYPHRAYPYSYGPSFGFTFSRSYSPGYSNDSGGLAVDVQRELRRRGYYHGSLDGDVGPGTRSAIRAYQYDRGLAVTGRIDRSLLHSLGIG